jgi:hypothetical protein
MILRVFFETADYTGKQAARWSRDQIAANFFISENSVCITRIGIDPGLRRHGDFEPNCF